VQISVVNAAGEQLLNCACPNDYMKIVNKVGSLGVVQHAAIEACCGAADLAEELIGRAAWPIDLAHPQYVAHLRKSPDKSDYSDGRLLADLTRVGYLPRVWLPSSYERDLRHLVNHRQSLVNRRRTVKLCIRALLREHRVRPPEKAVGWRKAWMNWLKTTPDLGSHARWIIDDLLEELEYLDKKISAAEKHLHQATANDPQVKKLLEEPGIGPVTAWILRGFVGRFSRFGNGKQLSRYCGLTPCNASSGKRQADAGLIQGCNKLLRATLIQSAHQLIRREERWGNLAQRLQKQGKAYGVIVAAVANRWMRGLWHRMSKERKAAMLAEA